MSINEEIMENEILDENAAPAEETTEQQTESADAPETMGAEAFEQKLELRLDE